MCQSLFAKPSIAARYEKIGKLYKDGKYAHVLRQIRTLELDRFGKDGRLAYTLRHDVLYYHYKLSAKIKLNRIAPLTESVGLYERLRVIDSANHYTSQPQYAVFRKHLKQAAESTFARSQLSATRKITDALARQGDTTWVYARVYPTKETLHLAHADAVREYLKQYDYTFIDRRALAVEKQPSINEQVLALTQPYSHDFEKARAIYIWIVHHIAYDYTYSTYNAQNTFIKNSGVCDGFSKLFKEMCLLAGIKAERVTGYVHKSLTVNHAWNTIELKGKQFLVESTWASCVKPKVEYYYLISEKELGKTHRPADSK
ncbi:transglutaminase domain-containing protein [Pontibacter sp. MBLB2868]|uniref:transglutaminase domain-containing protein n=1 Tax=Pontibacter sp. MBLB2868 TaxID=3451555 RepID=UPI003F74E35E